MSQAPRIFNLTRKMHLKRSQAQRAIDECAAEWVAQGLTIRDLTLPESIAKRNEQAKMREPIAASELSNVVFSHPGARAERLLAREADRFCRVK